MSAVKNLRAMFEQKGETSPPDRGRSPGIPPSIGSESPRPLSKVRTDFIAIEKDGRIGLQRGISQDSNVSTTRKLSGGESDHTTPFSRPENRNIFADALSSRVTAKTSLQDQPIPESPRADAAPQAAAPPKVAQESKGETSAALSQKPARRVVGDSTAEKSGASETAPAPKMEAGPVNGTNRGKERVRDGTKDEPTKPSTSGTPRTVPKPLAVPSASRPTAKPAKSPTVSKAPKSPAESSTPKLPAKTPERASRQLEKTGTPRSNATATNTPRASSVRRPPPLQPSPASAGFVKPKPKSPTRPVRLPAGLTTHTAASVSKVNPSRQSLSRASGSFPMGESLGRSPSRASVATVATTATKTAGTKSLKRQNSTINRPRPSLGPPPKQPAKDHPPTKKDKEVDESFLARMMRPTASSASKSNDKAATPPRKPPIAASVKKPTSKADGKAVRRIAPRLAAPASTSGPSPAAPQEPATSQPVVEASHAPEAEEAIEVAKATEEAASLPPDAGQASSAQEIAPLVEEIASAEEAIELAKDVEDEVTLPEPSHDEEHSEQPVESENSLVSEVKELSLSDDRQSETPLVNGHHKDSVPASHDGPDGERGDDTLETKEERTTATSLVLE